MLITTSTGVLSGCLQPSKAALESAWRDATESGSNHSANAHILPHLMARAEREKTPYTLQAAPGLGYYFKVGTCT